MSSGRACARTTNADTAAAATTVIATWLPSVHLAMTVGLPRDDVDQEYETHDAETGHQAPRAGPCAAGAPRRPGATVQESDRARRRRDEHRGEHAEQPARSWNQPCTDRSAPRPTRSQKDGRRSADGCRSRRPDSPARGRPSPPLEPRAGRARGNSLPPAPTRASAPAGASRGAAILQAITIPRTSRQHRRGARAEEEQEERGRGARGRWKRSYDLDQHLLDRLLRRRQGESGDSPELMEKARRLRA